jgi:hypothetical protein
MSMGSPYVTTLRLRQARAKVLRGLEIDPPAYRLVEVTIWGNTVAVVDPVEFKVVWTDDRVSDEPTRAELNGLVRGGLALMQRARDRGICEPQDKDASRHAHEEKDASDAVLDQLYDSGEK